ncbi:MAG: hypothetical protein IJW86_06485 [Clostridia bacterium]|nr:hypothetical protein [Clostridia bacterium]
MNSDKYDNINGGKTSEYSPAQRGAMISVAVILIFLMSIFGVAGLHILVDDKEFSESENRVLTDMPKLTFSGIFDGSFMKSFESYLTDQFPFRDKIISLKTYADRVVGKNEENGVYIGQDDFLFDSQSEYNEAQVKEITDAIVSFTKSNKGVKRAFLLAPNSSYIYSDKLPKHLEMPNQRDQIRNIYNLLKKDKSLTWVNVCSLFEKSVKENDTLLYYKTDHHWTTRAAKKVFNVLKEKWGLTTTGNIYENVEAEPKYNFYTVSATFQGTLSSTAGVHDAYDTVEICVPKKSEGTYVVNFESSSLKTPSLFFEEKLEQKNHYEVFLGGNYDKVIISTVSQSPNTLLLIKDSYANCMIPMLTPYFGKIVVLDPRYLTDSLDSIVKENDFTHILFLYNLNTFLEDTSLAQCLAS